MPEYIATVDFGAGGGREVEIDVDYDWMWEYITEDISDDTKVQWIEDCALLSEVISSSECVDVLDALDKEDILKYVAKMLDIEEET